MTLRRLQVGDVLTSNAFQYGYLNTRFHDAPAEHLNEIVMAGVTTIIDEGRISEDARVAMAATSGKIPPKIIRNSHYHNDRSRARAEFVVVEIGHYSSSQERGSCYADYVVIQRLNKNGTFDPKGELLWFFTNGSIGASNYIDGKKLKLVRHIERSFR